MPTREPEDGKCAARVKNIPEDMDVDVAYCANPEGFRVDGDANRCYLHGGASTGAPENNVRAQKHGIHTKRQRYYNNCSEEEQVWIDSVIESILDDMPGSNEPSFAKLQIVRNIAIDMHKLRNANDYIDEKGVVHRDKTVGYTDDGRPIKEDQENAVNIAYDRLNRTMTRQMEKLGVLDSPESQQADAQESIADELSKLRQERDE